ncbi:MAG: hypothetical protein ACLU3I_22030 [Acutalibacteraceae bacterium]
MKFWPRSLRGAIVEYQPVSNDNYEELVSRMDDYIAEFEAHGTDNILISDMDQP